MSFYMAMTDHWIDDTPVGQDVPLDQVQIRPFQNGDELNLITFQFECVQVQPFAQEPWPCLTSPQPWPEFSPCLKPGPSPDPQPGPCSHPLPLIVLLSAEQPHFHPDAAHAHLEVLCKHVPCEHCACGSGGRKKNRGDRHGGTYYKHSGRYVLCCVSDSRKLCG